MWLILILRTRGSIARQSEKHLADVHPPYKHNGPGLVGREQYLLIFEINEEALHIEGRAKTCRSKRVPLLHNDWRWKERYRCASNKISQPLFIISLNPLPLRGKLSAVDFPGLFRSPRFFVPSCMQVHRGESRTGWRSLQYSIPLHDPWFVSRENRTRISS
jgi:hypothetical protein